LTVGEANTTHREDVMTVTTERHGLGGRLPLADPATLTATQQELFDAVHRTRVPWGAAAGFDVTAPDGRLIGPFNAFLLRPEVAEKFLEFRTAASASAILSEREREIVIVAVGAVWGAEYELYAHTALAGRAGLSHEAVTDLLHGITPESLSDREKLAARVTRDLATTHRVTDELYGEAEKAFGPEGLFDIAALMGQYQTVCGLLCLFDVPAPK
jgi:4-carboxymuconolactone decarboxylase